MFFYYKKGLHRIRIKAINAINESLLLEWEVNGEIFDYNELMNYYTTVVGCEYFEIIFDKII